MNRVKCRITISVGVMSHLKVKFSLPIFVIGLIVSLAVNAEFQKSPNDHREYLPFELANRLQVLVISDPETTQAAASLAVRIGAGDDPLDRAGMAHYLEHMLFLGTEKYPELDGYRGFIEQNGGSSNASTGIDYTNYNFRIDADHLWPALDRFAQFFIAPLLPAQQIDRERAVVHSEFEVRTQRDAVLRWSAMRQTYNPKHPASRFASGTKDTLAGDIRQELIQFFEEKYSANLMSLVVLGREPVEQLKSWVEEIFTDIPNIDAPERVINEPLFVPGSLPALLQFKTLKDDPSLTLMFPLPDLEQYWRERPGSYIAHLLGHEGEGSLLSELKANGWALGLIAATGNTGITTSTFTVRVSLTESGFENWRDVVAHIFQYTREVRKRGIDEWRFEENKALSEIEFRFVEFDNVGSAVTFLATELHRYPPDELLTALYLVENFDSELIVDVLDHLTPDNVMVILASPDVETDRVTPYLRSEYSISKPAQETVDYWSSDVADASDWLPAPNEFVPNDLGLIASEGASIPELIFSAPGIELWHQADTSFDVPRASFFVTVRSPKARNSLRESMLLSLYVDGINEQMNEYVYPALIAGLEYSLYPHSRGFSFRISGFSDNQSVLLERILSTLKSAAIDREKFELHRREMIRSIENSRKDTAYRQATGEFYSLMIVPNWTDEEKIEALLGLEYEDLTEFGSSYFDRTDIVVLSHGNVDRSDAENMGRMVATLVNPENVVEVRKSQVVDMPDNDGPFYRSLEIDNKDSAISLYIQGDDQSVENKAYMSLLGQVVSTPFFSELRSVQKLGYIVFSYYSPVGEVPGITFTIQSADVDPDSMKAAIDEFLDDFPDQFLKVSDEEFEAFKSGLVGQLRKKHDSLSERSEIYWTSLDRKDFKFELREATAKAIEKIDRQSFNDFVRDSLTGHYERRLFILGYGKNHGLPDHPIEYDGVRITDVNQFQQGLELFSQD